MPEPAASDPPPSEGSRPESLADVLRETAEVASDPEAVLDVMVRHCATVVGDLAVVRVLAPDGRALRAGARHHRDPRHGALVAEISATNEEVCDEGAAEHLADARPALVVGPVEVPASQRQGAFARYVRDVGISSALVAPLRSRERTLGLLSITRDNGRPPLGDDDLAFAVAVAERVGVVYDNALLFRRQALHATVLDVVDAAVVAADAQGRITTFNPAAERLFGWSSAEVLGRRAREITSAEPDERIDELRALLFEHGRHSGRLLLRHRSGETFPGQATTALFRAEGQPIGMVSVFEDLTEREGLIAQLERRVTQQAAIAALGERALEADDPATFLDEAVEHVRATLDAGLAALCSPDGGDLLVRAGAGVTPGVVRQGRLTGARAASQEAFTLAEREAVMVTDGEQETRFAQSGLARGHGVRSAVTVVVPGRAEPHGVLGVYAAEPEAFDDDDLVFVQAVANVLGDALDRWGAEEAVRRRGLHDPLTELPNRTLILDRLAHALDRADRSSATVALLFLDLDRFKEVNDGLGHRAGDQLLCEVARRLVRAVRPADTVGRFGGDEFVVVCEDVAGQPMARTIAERLLATFADPFQLDGEQVQVGASIGVVVREEPVDAERLLRDADAAMYRAKERGRAGVELFSTGARSHGHGHGPSATALRRALAAEELVLHYQPIVALDDGRLVGLEALVRWAVPSRELLLPGAFLPMAAERGLAPAVDRYVLTRAARQSAAWAAARPQRAPLSVAVNLAARDLDDPALTDAVAEALSRAGGPPLALEVPAVALAQDTRARLRLLDRLHGTGASLTLDGFGSTPLALDVLAGAPLDGVKLDRALVAAADDDARRILAAATATARALGLAVTAVGVEDEAQRDALGALGCERAQGFLLGRPVAPEELDALVRAAP